MMKIKYLYELEPYPEELLKSIFKENYNNFLLETGKREILKLSNLGYGFEYVGIISINNILVSFLPKFLKDKKVDKKEVTIKTMKVLKKYQNSKKENFGLNLEETNGFNKLSLIDFFFKDFIEYGLYESDKEYKELNGDGEIDWEQTIEEINPLIQNSNPYYLNWYSTESETNKNSYIRRLHQFVLLKSLDYLNNNELLDFIANIIDIPNFDFNLDEEGLGKEKFQIKMIEESLREEFFQRKINLLKNMKSFLENENMNFNNSVKLLGIKDFYNVWEKICQDVFDDDYSKNNQLKTIMRKATAPIWKDLGKQKSMIPDIVIDKKEKLTVLDAKYYRIEKKNSKSKNINIPGVQDIAKQFIYEDVYREYYKSQGVEKEFENGFIVPSIETKKFDVITMKYFKDRKVIVWKWNYDELFDCYLNGKKKKI